jgi:hypothetical protein
MDKTIGLLGALAFIGCGGASIPPGAQDPATDTSKADSPSAPDFLPEVQLQTPTGNTVLIDFYTNPPTGAGFASPGLIIRYRDDANLFAHAIGIDADVTVHKSDGSAASPARIGVVDSTGNPSGEKRVTYNGVFIVGDALLASLDLTFSSGGKRDPATDSLHVNFDHPDTRCLVVLRDVNAPKDFPHIPEVSPPASFVWTGTIDVSEKALDGAAVGVQWKASVGDLKSSELVTKQVPGAPNGFQRFAFELSHDTLSTGGLDETLIAGFELQLIPFINLPNGARLFDHNRVPDLQSYVLWSGDTAGGAVPDGGPLGKLWTIANDPKVCATAGSP